MPVIEGNMQCNNLEMTLFYTTVSEHNVSVRVQLRCSNSYTAVAGCAEGWVWET